ncbi:MAG: HAD-IA family hydrolase [Rectinemataceae bacterium]|jgi:HAD superfamily hydrolase (TIGR01509 family)
MAELAALFFDMDGVIIDTERDGHRVAFNAAFREFGIDAAWGVDYYHELLQIGGGKERLRFFFDAAGFSRSDYLADQEEFIKKLHLRKTEILIELIRKRELPLRPGVERLMKECNAEGVPIGICTTSDEKAARAILESMLSQVRIDLVLAGDVVKRKKPDPEIYLLAVERLKANPVYSFVVEDSRIGVQAASAAGLHVVATVNDYTKDENLEAADFVVDCLGEISGNTARLLRGGTRLPFHGLVDILLLEGYLHG